MRCTPFWPLSQSRRARPPRSMSGSWPSRSWPPRLLYRSSTGISSSKSWSRSTLRPPLFSQKREWALADRVFERRIVSIRLRSLQGCIQKSPRLLAGDVFAELRSTNLSEFSRWVWSSGIRTQIKSVSGMNSSILISSVSSPGTSLLSMCTGTKKPSWFTGSLRKS